MQYQHNDDEIDLVEQLRRLWLCRRVVLYVTIAFAVVGCAVALLLQKEYEASCDVIPQATTSATLSRMSSLAALAGINVGEIHEENMLSPYIYEDIFYSVRFGKELLQSKVISCRYAEPITLFEYLVGEQAYKEPHVSNCGPTTGVDVVTRADYAALKELNRRVTLTLDDSKGLLTIAALMPEPEVAAEVVGIALEELQRYITRLKIEKVQSNLDFITEQYSCARRRFEDVQSRRARFRDMNHNTIRHTAMSELEMLDAEYSLAMNIYNELAMQMEQAKIKVRETMPILTIVSPVSIPFRKNRPRRLIIITTFVVAGVVVGSLFALSIPTLAAITGYRSLLRFLPKEALMEDEKLSRNFHSKNNEYDHDI